MGKIKAITRDQAIARARSMIGAPIHYQLKDQNGGRDPDAADPASHWHDEHDQPVATCDCAGFVAWSLGYDRFQPGSFPYWDGWINTDSSIFEAEHAAHWFAVLAAPVPGCLVVFPSLHTDAIKRVGHVGLVVDAPAGGAVRVVHCSHGNDAKLGYAVAETDDTPWRDAAGAPPKHRRYLAYQKQAP